MAPDFDAVIVGCGPVGAFLALLLSQQGMKVLVVEREQETAVFGSPRAVAMDDVTLRLLGLHRQTSDHDNLSACTEREAVLRCPIDLRSGPPPDALKGLFTSSYSVVGPDPPFFSEETGLYDTVFFHQPTFERLQREILLSRRGLSVTAFFGHSFVGYRSEGQRFEVTLQDAAAGSKKEVTCRWLLGCDGGSSVVRRAAGISFPGRTFPDQPWLVVDCETSDPSILQRWQCFNFIADPNRPYVHVPLPGPQGGRRFEFMLNPGEDGEAISKDREAIARLLMDHAGVDISAVKVIRVALYTFHDREASSWWTPVPAPNNSAALCLLGDAAHCMPPFRGQGMCAGMRDAAALFWRLAQLKALAADQAASGSNHDDGGVQRLLLDTYEAERREHLRSVVKVAVTMGSLITVRNRYLALLRNVVVGFLYRFPLSAPFFKKPFAPPARLDCGLFDFCTGPRHRGGTMGSALVRQRCVGMMLPNYPLKGLAADSTRPIEASKVARADLAEMRWDRWVERLCQMPGREGQASAPQWVLLLAPQCILDPVVKERTAALMKALGQKSGVSSPTAASAFCLPFALPMLEVVQLYPGSGALTMAAAHHGRFLEGAESTFPLVDACSLYTLYLQRHACECVLVRPDLFVYGGYAMDELLTRLRLHHTQEATQHGANAELCNVRRRMSLLWRAYYWLQGIAYEHSVLFGAVLVLLLSVLLALVGLLY